MLPIPLLIVFALSPLDRASPVRAEEDDPKVACHASCKQKMIACHSGCIDVKAAKMKEWCKEVCWDEANRCHDVCDDPEAEKTDKAWRARCQLECYPDYRDCVAEACPDADPKCVDPQMDVEGDCLKKNATCLGDCK